MHGHRLVLNLSGLPTAAREARALLRSWMLERSCREDDIETAELLVTEIVANAVRHTDSPALALTAEQQSATIRVAVHDCSTTPPTAPPETVDPERPGGRGVWLVAQLSRAWGWEPLPDGKRVWFEVACGPASPRQSW